jgi:hypothetical protein
MLLADGAMMTVATVKVRELWRARWILCRRPSLIPHYKMEAQQRRRRADPYWKSTRPR